MLWSDGRKSVVGGRNRAVIGKQTVVGGRSVVGNQTVVGGRTGQKSDCGRKQLLISAVHKRNNDKEGSAKAETHANLMGNTARATGGDE